MKRFLFIALSLVFLFACKNPQNDGGSPSDKTEEFTVNFKVEGDGGSLTAKIKDGEDITTGKKVLKDKEVVFTAKPNGSYSIESWTLDGKPVAETELKNEKKEYTLKITKDVNLVVKFTTGGGAPTLKDIQIDKIILGYPNISDRDGKEVKGEDLNENANIPDFEVPDEKFPVQVYHKTQFSVEQVFVTFDGTKEELSSSITKTLLTKDYKLVQDKKTPIVVDIIGEGYKPLKLTFNVTYKKAEKKYVDDITNITISTSAIGGVAVYGGAGNPIANLKNEQTTLDISIAEPTIRLYVNKGSGGQPKLDVKLDELKLNEDFEAGKGNLSFKLPKLTAGKHNVKMSITKEGYEAGEYNFNLVYKPTLTFKKITINGTDYTKLSAISGKTITFEPTDADPVVLSGEVEEEGVDLYFSVYKSDKKYHKIPDSKISVPQGETLYIRMYAKKEGCTTFFVTFKLKRNKVVEKIEITKITVDGTEVAKGGAIEVEKAEAKVNLVLTLKKKYSDVSFTINDAPGFVELDTTGTIATFSDFGVTKDGSLPLKIKASAQPDYADCEETITITHKTKAQQATEVYIDGVSIALYDEDEEDYLDDEDLKKVGANWEGTVGEGPHMFTISVDAKDKDITDVTKFKLSMKDSTSGKVYFDTITGQVRANNHIRFLRKQDTAGATINLATGKHTLDVTLYYEDKVVESCQFIVTIK